MIRLTVLACLVALLALVACGYPISFAPPATWWTDGGASGPDGIIREPLIRR